MSKAVISGQRLQLSCISLLLVLLVRGTDDVVSLPRSPEQMFSDAFKFEGQVEFRNIEGNGNNKLNSGWGKINQPLVRLVDSAYERFDEPSGSHRPNARELSNVICTQAGSTGNKHQCSDLFWLWGQFVDHDIALVTMNDKESFNITIPLGDPLFDPFRTGDKMFSFARSRSMYEDSGRSVQRNQISSVTPFLDGSMIYGSDSARASGLRSFSMGKLKTSRDNLLPYNTKGFENEDMANGRDPDFYLAGDVRVNEHVGLTAIHTLFVREHNHWADVIAHHYKTNHDDTIYEMCKAIVTAEIQAITFNEFLPLLLGEMGGYSGYDANKKMVIFNEFTTAAFRFGHSMVSPTLNQRSAGGVVSGIALRDAFFKPQLTEQDGIDDMFRGLATNPAMELDLQVVDDLRDFLFGPPGAGGLDLASFNIQRGRDHGFPSYSKYQEKMFGRSIDSWEDVTTDRAVQRQLGFIYESVHDCDVWVCGLAENVVDGGVVGHTFNHIIKLQFNTLRSADRFWYENYLSPPMVQAVNSVKLAHIVKRNTLVGDEVGSDMLTVKGGGGGGFTTDVPRTGGRGGFTTGVPRAGGGSFTGEGFTNRVRGNF